MPDIFGGVVNSIFQPGLMQGKRKLERAQANSNIEGLYNAMQTHQEQTIKGGAELNQSMYGRGLGRSTLATQEKTWFADQRGRQMYDLQNRFHIAQMYKSYLKKRHRYERYNYYAGMMDLAVNTALTAVSMILGGAGKSSTTGGQAQLQSMGGAANTYASGPGWEM
jgi:hypothetical protein